MKHLIVTLLRILIHTEEKPYDKSVHTGEEPSIYDYITVSPVNKHDSREYPLSNLLVRINPFSHGERLASKILLIKCLNLF